MFSCILDKTNPAVVSIRDIFTNFSLFFFFFFYCHITTAQVPWWVKFLSSFELQSNSIYIYIYIYIFYWNQTIYSKFNYKLLYIMLLCCTSMLICMFCPILRVCHCLLWLHCQFSGPSFCMTSFKPQRPDYFSTHLPESLLDPPNTCWRKHFWGFCPVFTIITLSKHNHFHMFTCTHTVDAHERLTPNVNYSSDNLMNLQLSVEHRASNTKVMSSIPRASKNR